MISSRLEGHVWTIRPWLSHVLRPVPHPRAVPWSTFVDDARLGPVRLKGLFSEAAGSRDAVVVVHGLSGSIESQYVVAAACAAERARMSCLCLNLRGAPRDGEDIYHAGLTADVRAALASEALASYETLYVLGYSLGGHLALRHATEDLDPRVRAVAAVCPPLDFDRAVASLDEPASWIYRQNIMTGLKEAFAAVTVRRPELRLPTFAEVRDIPTIRSWDEHVVAPRWGFRSAEHYYAETSVGPSLSNVKRPALVVVATADPMIPVETVRPALSLDHPLLDVRWVDEGGHVGFPASFDLGLGGDTGLEPQVLRWLRRAATI